MREYGMKRYNTVSFGMPRRPLDLHSDLQNCEQRWLRAFLVHPASPLTSKETQLERSGVLSPHEEYSRSKSCGRLRAIDRPESV